MSDIDVAIVIVTYKSATLTIDCLKTIEPERATPGMRLRVIIVDNKSGDVPVIAKAIEDNGWSSWATVFEAPINGGFSYGNNTGTQRAYDDGAPDYVHYLNPDTLVHKGGITELVKFLESHPDAGIAVSHFHNADGSDWPYVFRFPSLLSELEGGLQIGLFTKLLQRWVVLKRVDPVAQEIDWGGGASMMIRRKVLDTVGGYDQQFFLWREETDVSLRAKHAGFATWYVPQSKIVHIGQQSTSPTEQEWRKKPLPGYWFESRNHYFVVNHGVPYTIAADLMAVLGNSVGHLRRLLRRRAHEGIPHFLSDLVRYSVLLPANRKRAAGRQIARFAAGKVPASGSSRATPDFKTVQASTSTVGIRS